MCWAYVHVKVGRMIRFSFVWCPAPIHQRLCSAERTAQARVQCTLSVRGRKWRTRSHMCKYIHGMQLRHFIKIFSRFALNVLSVVKCDSVPTIAVEMRKHFHPPEIASIMGITTVAMLTHTHAHSHTHTSYTTYDYIIQIWNGFKWWRHETFKYMRIVRFLYVDPYSHNKIICNAFLCDILMSHSIAKQVDILWICHAKGTLPRNANRETAFAPGCNWCLSQGAKSRTAPRLHIRM